MIITASTINCALTVCQVGNIPNSSTCGVGARLTATQPASCRAEIPLPAKTTANTAIKAELAEKKVAIGNWRLVRIKNQARSEEHTSELQSRPHLVCRLLLEKKKQSA